MTQHLIQHLGVSINLRQRSFIDERDMKWLTLHLLRGPVGRLAVLVKSDGIQRRSWSDVGRVSLIIGKPVRLLAYRIESGTIGEGNEYGMRYAYANATTAVFPVFFFCISIGIANPEQFSVNCC